MATYINRKTNKVYVGRRGMSGSLYIINHHSGHIWNSNGRHPLFTLYKSTLVGQETHGNPPVWEHFHLPIQFIIGLGVRRHD